MSWLSRQTLAVAATALLLLFSTAPPRCGPRLLPHPQLTASALALHPGQLVEVRRLPCYTQPAA